MTQADDEVDCDRTLRELDVFLDEELSEEARRTIAHHLDGCDGCTHAYDFHAELKRVIAAKCRADEMPPGLLSRIERCFETDLDGDGRIG
ncbi:zf-HC2 domain-containing protein [Ilumatobacter sp.]|uniref:zf-HC2 domain-containing protein n=1 Tax=Ilumatobacter sp. TaxID=1967498 RepID=UPI003B520A04